jgi:phosphohistidine phosphatase
MIQLVLARHAKSDWGDPSVDDHDRPLNTRGLRDAPEMAKRVVRAGVRPEILLTSTALRARTTAGYFAAEFGVTAIEQEELYGAPPEALLAAARASGASEVMVVAHDPGLSELVSELSDREVHMPTCAVAIFTWNDGGWDDVGVTAPDDVSVLVPN